eukprot:m.102345 g.102345  ORF g.102345 m.102345 type:complete len:78 (+) comp15011_c1_seq1:133-366(+)
MTTTKQQTSNLKPIPKQDASWPHGGCCYSSSEANIHSICPTPGCAGVQGVQMMKHRQFLAVHNLFDKEVTRGCAYIV